MGNRHSVDASATPTIIDHALDVRAAESRAASRSAHRRHSDAGERLEQLRGIVRAQRERLTRPLTVVVSAPLGVPLAKLCTQLAVHLAGDMVSALPAHESSLRRTQVYADALSAPMVRREPGSHFHWHLNNLLAQSYRYMHAPRADALVHVCAQSALDEVLAYARASRDLQLIDEREFAALLGHGDLAWHHMQRYYDERHTLYVYLRPKQTRYEGMVRAVTASSESTLPQEYYLHSAACLDTLYSSVDSVVRRRYTLFVELDSIDVADEHERLLVCHAILQRVEALCAARAWGVSEVLRAHALHSLSQQQLPTSPVRVAHDDPTAAAAANNDTSKDASLAVDQQQYALWEAAAACAHPSSSGSELHGRECGTPFCVMAAELEAVAATQHTNKTTQERPLRRHNSLDMHHMRHESLTDLNRRQLASSPLSTTTTHLSKAVVAPSNVYAPR